MNVIEACRDLAKHGLVKCSSGNASARLDNTYMVIKASGSRCDHPEMTTVKISDGTWSSSSPKPSTDSDAHRYVYRHLPDVNGIVHTHSPCATAFAVAQIPIACCMTQLSDEFGGDIPLTEYCEIGGEHIGLEIVRLAKKCGATAFLIRQHGVFTIGKTLDDAVRKAIVLEECAKTVYFASHLGCPKKIPQAEIEANHHRYTESYGQSSRQGRICRP